MSDLWKDRLRSRETLVTNKSEKIKNVSEQSKTSKRKRQTHKKVTSIAKKKLKTVNTKKPTRFDKNNFREKEISTEDEFWSSPPAKLRVASFKTAIAQDKLKKIDDDGCWLMTPFSKKKSNTFSIRFSTPNLESPFKRFNVSQENLQQLPNLMTNLSDDSDDDTDQNLLFSDDEFENKTPSYEDQNSNFLALNITDGLFPAKVILLIFKYLLNSSSKFDLNFLILCKSWSLLGRAALWENLQFQTVGKMKGVFNIVCKKDATRNLILNQGLSKYGRAFLYSNFSSENEKKCIKVTNASENEKRIRTETLKAVEYSNLVKSFSYSFTQPKDNKTNFPVQCFFANDLFPNLTKIVFFGSPAWLNDSLFKVISRNNSITKNLQNFQLSNPGLTKFKFISKFKNLKILILENSLINDSELDFLGKNLKSLVKLCLPLSKHISSNGIDQFLLHYPEKNCPIQFLDLNSCSNLIDNSIFEILFQKNLLKLQNLHALNLGNILGLDYTTGLKNILLNNSNNLEKDGFKLKMLNLSNLKDFDDKGFLLLLKSLGSNLDILVLRNANHLKKSEVEKNLNNFSKKLKFIDLSGCDFNFIPKVKNNTNLKFIFDFEILF